MQVSWRLQNGTEQAGSTLTITYVTERLGGGYTCVATNSDGRQESTWYLKLQRE